MNGPKSLIPPPLRNNSACSQSPNPEFSECNSPSSHSFLSSSFSLLYFLQNSSSKEQFTLPFLPPPPFPTLCSTEHLLSFIIFYRPLQGESSLLPLIQPQLSPPLYRGHIYVFSFSQVSGYLNLMKVNFALFFPPFSTLPSSKKSVSKVVWVGAAQRKCKRIHWAAGKDTYYPYYSFHAFLNPISVYIISCIHINTVQTNTKFKRYMNT